MYGEPRVPIYIPSRPVSFPTALHLFSNIRPDVKCCLLKLHFLADIYVLLSRAASEDSSGGTKIQRGHENKKKPERGYRRLERDQDQTHGLCIWSIMSTDELHVRIANCFKHFTAIQ